MCSGMTTEEQRPGKSESQYLVDDMQGWYQPTVKKCQIKKRERMRHPAIPFCRNEIRLRQKRKRPIFSIGRLPMHEISSCEVGLFVVQVAVAAYTGCHIVADFGRIGRGTSGIPAGNIVERGVSIE